MHSFPGLDAVVEVDGHIGHGAVLHGCRIGRNSLVGMNAVVGDGVIIGESSFVAASAYVPAGAVIPARSLIAGVPAKIKRELTDKEIAWKREATAVYRVLAQRSMASMRATEPLPAVEVDRKRFPKLPLDPLYKFKHGARG